MIRLVNVNKYYQTGNDKIHVIKNLNYVFPNTGLIFILGPSGSGKTTLLNLLGGLDNADSGEIWIENREISTFTKKERSYYLNSYLGFVFQEYNILKDLNLKDNIKLALDIQNIKGKKAKEKINQIIKEVGLDGLEKRKVNQLSGGQKQRIAIARALVKEPNLIIADEPTGNLDSENSTKIFELFKKLSKNRLIIIVSHDDEAAKLYADDILKVDTANLNSEETSSDLTIESQVDIPTISYESKLYLEKTKTPFNSILKLSAINMWKKKFRYLLMLIITTISLVFLSFAIELNGDKLYQNVYTTINNNVNYTDIYQYHPKSTDNINQDFYTKYNKGELMNNSYDIIKNIDDSVIVHKYQPVSLDYAKYNVEKANFFYTGKINTLICYDYTNHYKLISGTLPNPSEPEILITDYLVEALKFFGVIDISSTVYNILGKYLNLGYNIDFKIVGVVETNYRKWQHLIKENLNYEVNYYDKDMQGFEYDHIMMNSIIVGETYYDYILNNSFNNSHINAGFYELNNNNLTIYNNERITDGSIPINYDEIVLPNAYLEQIINYHFDYSWERQSYIRYQLLNSYINISFTYNQVDLDGNLYNIETSYKYKIVGLTDANDFLITSENYSDFLNVINLAKANNKKENIIIELSNDPSVVLKQFKNLYNNDYHFIIDIFKYRDSIDSYNVDPMIEFISRGGLIVFTILTIGILWTIISIEIVDSRKEIGIMRSMGLSGFKISLIFVFQSLFVNVISYLISIPISQVIISSYGIGIMDSLGEISLSLYTLTYRSPIILFIFIIVITLISSILPLIKILSKKIINVINEREN